MQITALVKSPEHVSCRYRLAAYQPLLEPAGYHLELRTWPASWLARLALCRELARADVVIAQRSLLHGWQLRVLRRAIGILVYDFDDAVYLRNSYATRGPQSSTRARRFTAAVQVADAIVAGNAFLAKQAASCVPSGSIHVIPTCVPTERYVLAAHRRGGRDVHMVWIGSSSTLRGLQAITPTLESIGQSCPGVSLKLVCDRFLHLRHLPIIEHPWTKDGEALALAEADIGISWLPDDVWSRGKCGLKVLQYMAAGLPVVANPVGVQADMVRHGETGLLAETAEEWVAAVQCLASDPVLRRRMGQAGRQLVEAEFSTATGAMRWTELLDWLVSRKATYPPKKREPRCA